MEVGIVRGRDSILRDLGAYKSDSLAWSENVARKSYADLDRAHAILKANQAGKTMKQLEKVFGLSRKQLTRLKLLTKTPKVVQEAVTEGKISTTHAIVLNEMKGRYPKLDMLHWIAQLMEHTLSVQQLKNRITREHREERAPVRLVEEKEGVLHFRVRRLEVGKMSDEEKAEAVEALKAALLILRGGNAGE